MSFTRSLGLCVHTLTHASALLHPTSRTQSAPQLLWSHFQPQPPPAREGSCQSHNRWLRASLLDGAAHLRLRPLLCLKARPSHIPPEALASHAQVAGPLLMPFPRDWTASPQKSAWPHFRCHLTKGAPPASLGPYSTVLHLWGVLLCQTTERGAGLPLREDTGCHINADDLVEKELGGVHGVRAPGWGEQAGAGA